MEARRASTNATDLTAEGGANSVRTGLGVDMAAATDLTAVTGIGGGATTTMSSDTDPVEGKAAAHRRRDVTREGAADETTAGVVSAGTDCMADDTIEWTGTATTSGAGDSIGEKLPGGNSAES